MRRAAQGGCKGCPDTLCKGCLDTGHPWVARAGRVEHEYEYEYVYMYVYKYERGNHSWTI